MTEADGKQVKASAKQTASRVTGNRRTEAEGAEKTAGKVQKGFGDVKERSKALSESSSTLP